MPQHKECSFDEDLFRQKVLGVFASFHNYCESNGLRYFIAYGTLLGAVRHKGFIPWDDDVDVLMPRPDYDRFIEMTKNGMDGVYKVHSMYYTPNYCFGYAKVIDSTTTLVEFEHKIDCPSGAFVDVFPLDGYSPDEKKWKRLRKNFKKHYRRAWYLDSNHTKFLGKIRAFIYNIIYDKQKELLKADQIAKYYPYEEAKEVLVYVGSDHNLLSRSVFDQVIKLPFENLMVNSVAKYDYYLTIYYGNYMQLPPVNEQVSNHFHYFVDLHRGLTSEEIKKELEK